MCLWSWSSEFFFNMNLQLLNVCFLTVYYHDKINNIYNNIFIRISGIFAFAFAVDFRKKSELRKNN